MNRFKKHKLWMVTLLLSAPVVVLAAVPNIFQSGTVISSADVNANFAALDTRIAALEAAVSRSGAQLVMNNVTGPLPKSVAFQSGGGPLLLIVSGSAWKSAGGVMTVTVQLDAANVGDIVGFTNEAGSHKALVSRAFKVDAAAGNHTLQLLTGATAATNVDTSDYFSVTVVELAH
jgi:hypothetical protein